MVLSQTLFDTENESAEEELQPTGTKEKTTVSAPTGGRPMGTASSKFSLNGIKNAIKRLNDFESKAQAEYRKKSGIKRLNKDQKKLISDICSSIACDCESKDWDSKILEIIDDNSALLNLGVSDGVLSIAAEHGLDDYSAAILYHSDNFKDE
jgi:hypothetical protein